MRKRNLPYLRQLPIPPEESSRSRPGKPWWITAARDFGSSFLTQHLSSRGLVVLSNAKVLRIENEDLCLREEEIEEYYRMAGVELEKEQRQNLYRYSEGWIAALYLQLISFIRTGSLERKSSIFELVNELLWKELSREERHFFLSPLSFRQLYDLPSLLSAGGGTSSEGSGRGFEPLDVHPLRHGEPPLFSPCHSAGFRTPGPAGRTGIPAASHPLPSGKVVCPERRENPGPRFLPFPARTIRLSSL